MPSMNAPFAPPRTEKLRLRVEDFLLLNDSGAFDGYSKTELIDGDIYVMNAQHSPHARAQSRLLVELSLRLRELGSELEAYVEASVRLGDDTMPEPDITVTSWKGAGAVPVESVAMLVEVSETTLDTDLGRKSDLNAAAGIPEYWVVDLNEECILIHVEPSADGYLGQLDLPFGEPLSSATIEGLDLGVVRLIA